MCKQKVFNVSFATNFMCVNLCGLCNTTQYHQVQRDISLLSSSPSTNISDNHQTKSMPIKAKLKLNQTSNIYRNKSLIGIIFYCLLEQILFLFLVSSSLSPSWQVNAHSSLIINNDHHHDHLHRDHLLNQESTDYHFSYPSTSSSSPSYVNDAIAISSSNKPDHISTTRSQCK